MKTLTRTLFFPGERKGGAHAQEGAPQQQRRIQENQQEEARRVQPVTAVCAGQRRAPRPAKSRLKVFPSRLLTIGVIVHPVESSEPAMPIFSSLLIEPDLAEVFPDAESVNRALRLLAKMAAAAAPAAARRPGAPKKRPRG